MSKYLLIDGPFFEGLLREYSAYCDSDLFESIYWPRLVAPFHRATYYDALPTQKSDQSAEDFEAIEAKKLERLNRIRLQERVQVRDGVTRLRTKKQGKSTREVFEQKGVDTWIAVDALLIALNGLAEEIHIVTSDSDIYPVFEALQNTSSRGVLRYQEGRAINELVFSADIARPISFTEVTRWTNNFNHRLESHGNGFVYDWPKATDHECQGKRFVFCRDSSLRLACNVYLGNVCVQPASSTCWPLVTDWAIDKGADITYRETQSIYNKLADQESSQA